MTQLHQNDPTQTPDLHNDQDTFDDPIRKVGPDVTQTFDNSESNPTEWAGSEALETDQDDEEDEEAFENDDDLDLGVRADAPETGIDDADRSLAALDDEEDEADETDLDDDDDEDDDDLLDVDGTKKVR